MISTSSSVHRLKSCDALKTMASRPSVILVLLQLTIPISNATVFAIVMREAFQNYGATSKELGLYSVIGVPIAALGII